MIKEGYCEETARVSTIRVYDIRDCSNKAKYKVTYYSGHVINVCGTHLREYYQRDLDDKPIKGKWWNAVVKVEEIKTGKIIYEKNE